MKTIHYLSGLPRSGSTLLASLLNQNNDIYATSTSPLLDLLFLNEQAWRKNPSVFANEHKSQVQSLCDSIICGTWNHIDKPIIIDKHRAWARNISTIKQIINPNPKVIITVRDIPSIITSFINLLDKSKQNPNYIDKILVERNLPINIETRSELLWNEFIYDTWDSAKTGYVNNHQHILFVHYDDIVTKPEETLKKVYDFIEIPYQNPIINNIVNATNEDDLKAWGLENLHYIRPLLKKTSMNPIELLGSKIYDKYNKPEQYEFWNK